MRLQLEFIERRQTPLLGIGLCICTVLLCGWALLQWHDAYDQEQLARKRLVTLEQATKEREHAVQLQKSQKDPAALQRAKEEKKILDALRYPWNRVLASVEEADSENVALLSMTHEQSSGVTQLQVEALNTAALNAYVDKLNVGNDDSGDVWYVSTYQIEAQKNPPIVKGTIFLMTRSTNPPLHR